MKDRWGRTSAEVDDAHKHERAEGTLKAWEVQEFLQRLRAEGRITKAEYDKTIDALYLSWEQLACATIESAGTPTWSDEKLEKYYSYCSDGTPVVSITGDLARPSNYKYPVGLAYAVSWLPSYAYPMRTSGPKPPECTVVVNHPPRQELSVKKLSNTKSGSGATQ